ncbi:hypothetical protein BDV93DRAFT_602339 [Ceratobasidium sp. AG-I]|nr:hypothetical protein BDV93DRAFT_602339 [Ceratobasidium sp. AG-I]
MPAPTRTELEGWKRPALQQKCKELGIKANGKTEVLIELLVSHYESQEGPQSGSSKPTTSNKRKAPAAASKSRATADEDPAESSGDEQIASADAATSAPQRQASTRRKALQNPAGPPPAKIRRVGVKSRVKVEPSEPTGLVDRAVGQYTAYASPRRAQIMEVVLASPAVAGKGKAKAREAPPKIGRSEVESDGEDDSGEASGPSQTMKARASASSAPLLAQRTATTEIDVAPPNDISLHSSVDSDQTRIADLELQVRNARKFNDEVARDVSNLKGMHQAIRHALGDTEPSNIADNLAPLVQLRDIAPKLIAVSNFDVDAATSRIESNRKRLEGLEIGAQQDRSDIAELKERVRELEEGKSAIGDLEALVRQLQSQINMLPAVMSQNSNPVEDSGTERIYTIIRGPSHENSALPSSSQHRPSSRLSVPPEDSLHPLSQDQNQGRSSSVSRGLRATRPPLAEKEGVRVGQPDVEVETADPRRSIRRIAESLPGSSATSAPPSRARSSTPSQREPLSANPTPSRGKGKGRMNKRSALDTVEEDGDGNAFEEPLRSSTPVAAFSALPEQEPIETLDVDAVPAVSDSEADQDIQHLPSPPPAPNPFSPTIEAPRSPARFFEAGRRESSGSPPSSASKPSSKGQQHGSSPSRASLVPPTLGDTGPIASLPFKLIASPTKPQEGAAPSTSRAPASTGRVPKAPRSSHLPYSRRPGGSRMTSESANDAPTTGTGMPNFALPETLSAFPSTTSTLGALRSPGPSNSLIDNPAGFITPERLESNFSLFPPTRFDFGQTPGGLAFKTTGRAPPGTPAVTTTLFGTEVARDTRFADLPYDPEAGRGSSSWEESVPLWPGAAPRNTTN